MFTRYKGKTKTVWMPKKASTEFSIGDAVAAGTGADNGHVIPATSLTGSLRLMGVIKKAVSSDDSDYADNTRVPVEVPVDRLVEFTVDTASNTLSLSQVQDKVGQEIDFSDASTVNLESSSTTVALVRDVISTAKVAVTLKVNDSY